MFQQVGQRFGSGWQPVDVKLQPPVPIEPPWRPGIDGELDKRNAELRPGPGVVNEYRVPGVMGQFSDSDFGGW